MENKSKVEQEEMKKNQDNVEHKEHLEHEEKHKKDHKEMVPKTEYDELNDHYKRILAEFDNYKKRSQKER